MDIKRITSTYNFSIIFRRAIGWWLDLLILGFLYVIVVACDLYFTEGNHAISVFFIWLVISFVFLIVLEGQTGYSLGKWCLRIKVVDEHGAAPGIFKASLRNGVKIIEANPILFNGIVAGITSISTKHKQRLGDLLAHTYVVLIDDINNHPQQGLLSNQLKTLNESVEA